MFSASLVNQRFSQILSGEPYDYGQHGNQKAYPQEIANEIQKMPPLATQIANRWMLGWPKTVKALIASGEYLEAPKIQEEEERKALIEPGLNHLSSWEKVEVMGLTQAPPSSSTEPDEEA